MTTREDLRDSAIDPDYVLASIGDVLRFAQD